MCVLGYILFIVYHMCGDLISWVTYITNERANWKQFCNEIFVKKQLLFFNFVNQTWICLLTNRLTGVGDCEKWKVRISIRIEYNKNVAWNPTAKVNIHITEAPWRGYYPNKAAIYEATTPVVLLSQLSSWFTINLKLTSPIIRQDMPI